MIAESYFPFMTSSNRFLHQVIHYNYVLFLPLSQFIINHPRLFLFIGPFLI